MESNLIQLKITPINTNGMKIKSSLSCLFLLMFFLSCNQNNDSYCPVISPDSFVEKEIFLSQFTNTISYIPLDSCVKFSHILDIEISDDYYFIGAYPAGILVYNHEGKFIRKIGRIGNGPGEYKYALSFTVNPVQKTIYLLDLQNILVYNYNGEFIRQISFSNYNASFSDIVFFNNQLYLFEDIVYGQATYNWLVMDTVGNYSFSKKNSISPFKTTIGFTSRIFKSDKSLYYWNHYNDTIFKIDGKTFSPGYLFSDGDFRLAEKYILGQNPEKHSFFPERFVDTKDYLFFFYDYKKYLYTSFYDKSSRQFFSINSTNDIEKRWAGPGIINDIDGGLPFAPFTSFSNEGSELLLGWNFAYEFKNRETSKSLHLKYPDRKKALKKLVNGLNENDNPVLVVVKLKE